MLGRVLRLLPVLGVALLACGVATQVAAQDAIGPPEFAGIFGSRDLVVENPNNPGTNYTMVLHDNSEAGYDAIEYDPARGWGFEVIDPGNTGRNTSARFGPFDDSPNNRNKNREPKKPLRKNPTGKTGMSGWPPSLIITKNARRASMRRLSKTPRNG